MSRQRKNTFCVPQYALSPQAQVKRSAEHLPLWQHVHLNCHCLSAGTGLTHPHCQTLVVSTRDKVMHTEVTHTWRGQHQRKGNICYQADKYPQGPAHESGNSQPSAEEGEGTPRPCTKPSGDAPNQPCTSSSRMTLKLHASTCCLVISSYLQHHMQHRCSYAVTFPSTTSITELHSGRTMCTACPEVLAGN